MSTVCQFEVLQKIIKIFCLQRNIKFVPLDQNFLLFSKND